MTIDKKDVEYIKKLYTATYKSAECVKEEIGKALENIKNEIECFKSTIEEKKKYALYGYKFDKILLENCQRDLKLYEAVLKSMD